MAKETRGKVAVEDTSITSPNVLKKRKKKKWLFVIIFFILILVALGYFFRKPLLNGAKNIPIVGKWIPKVSYVEPLSAEALSLKMQEQVEEIEKLKAEKVNWEKDYMSLSTENERLKQYESMYTEFLEQKEAWDEELAKENPDLFIEQFEKIYPDTAERIYTLLKGQKNLSNEQKTLSKTIEGMDEVQAAKALELLIATDSELLKMIFEGMSTDRRALVLNEMSSELAAQVIKLIAPES